MRPLALFIVGEPGCGKTAVARRLIEVDSYLVPKPKWTVGEKVCAAGHYSGGVFDGADTVPYNGVADALAYWEAVLSARELTIFDGDRFSDAGVLERVGKLADLACVHLTLPAEVAQARRDARGSKQSPAWLKGRKTKAARFAEMLSVSVAIDARLAPDEIARIALEVRASRVAGCAP